MPPGDPEIIDLTASSPKYYFIELDSDGEIIDGDAAMPTASEKREGRKRKRRRKGKSSAVEEGEITQDSAEASLEYTPDRANGVRAVVGGGSRNGASRTHRDLGAKASSAKSLLDRLASPHPASPGARIASGRDEARLNDRDKPRKRRDRRSPRPDRGNRRRSRSPDPSQPHSSNVQDDRTRHNGIAEGRRRSRSPGREAVAESIASDLFFEDVARADVSVAPHTVPSTQVEVQEGIQDSVVSLSLPAHVSVVDQGDGDPIPIVAPPDADSEGEGYIEYLDYDDERRVGMVRYFDTVEGDEKPAKPKTFVCKNCGAEGEHKTYECPVLICLTCGARDEHATRGCPISKTCFNCGMKGHINKTCPNRFNGRGGPSHFDDCNRCGSRAHNTNECPTLWRLYDYVDDTERQDILRIHEEKSTLAFGQGGEGYIATDEWCYNCGGSGHLGDDCAEIPHVPDFPREPSAFSVYNILSGPFADPNAHLPSKRRVTRRPRDWEVASAFADGHGSEIPMDVGKQGRRKERARMEKRARDLEDTRDDPDDWFGSRARGSNTVDNPCRVSAKGGGGAKKMNFNLSDPSRRDNTRRGDDRNRRHIDDFDLPGPSRETDSIQIRGAARFEERGSGRYNEARAGVRRERMGSRRHEDRGPQYKGSYAR